MGEYAFRFGVCCGPDRISELRRFGYDYAELGLAALAALDEADYKAIKERVPADFRVEAVNGMLPGSIHLSDGRFSVVQCRDYLWRAFERAVSLGVEIAVFGSGGSRSYVEGFDRAIADEQILTFGRILAEQAGVFGITAVVEPLRRRECNNLNTVLDALDFARRVDSPHLCVLADLYHMADDGEPMSDILEAGALLRHCHIANPDGRVAPGPDDRYDYAPFFDALRTIGYRGRISLECAMPDFESEAPRALAVLRSFM